MRLHSIDDATKKVRGVLLPPGIRGGQEFGERGALVAGPDGLS